MDDHFHVEKVRIKNSDATASRLVFRFLPSHPEDQTVIGTYRDYMAARKIADALNYALLRQERDRFEALPVAKSSEVVR